MITLLLTGLLLQEPTAEDTLHNIENKITSAKAVSFRAREVIEDWNIWVGREDQSEKEWTRQMSTTVVEVSAAFQGNQCSLSLESSHGYGSMRVISDGQRLAYFIKDRQHILMNTPENLRANLNVLTSRWVVEGPFHEWSALFGKDRNNPKNLDGRYTLSNLRKGEEDGALRTLSYNLKSPELPLSLIEGKLWYDPKTLTIARRTFKYAGLDVEVKSSYTHWVFEEELPDTIFKMPVRQY